MLLHLHLLFICCLQLLCGRSHARGLPQSFVDRTARLYGYDSIDGAPGWTPNLASSALQPRQDDGSDVVLNCDSSCDLGTCSSCNGPSKRGLAERDFDLAITLNISAENVTLYPWSGKLEKRIFRIDNAGTAYLNPASPNGYTIGRVRTYMVQQVYATAGTYDNQYGGLNGFFVDDERAVSQQYTFGTESFQFGTYGLHGCTMVAVVSRRGVWQAHFWESYSNSKPNSDSTPNAAFNERVIDFITGTTVTNPTNPPANADFYDDDYEGIWKPYVAPTGPSLDPTLFNRPETDGFNANAPITDANYPGDNTKIYIMTPVADGQPNAASTMKYPNRIALIVSTIKGLIAGTSGRIPVTYYNYKRLLLNRDGTGPDAAQANTNERGMCLFQYDPNANGNGLQQWRIFYEGRLNGGTATVI